MANRREGFNPEQSTLYLHLILKIIITYKDSTKNGEKALNFHVKKSYK